MKDTNSSSPEPGGHSRAERSCGKTSRIHRPMPRVGRIILIITGFMSLIWFLIRVIPKPSRAAYPCQRAAAPAASAFVLWLLGLAGSVWAWNAGKHWARRSFLLKAWACFCLAGAIGAWVFVQFPSLSARADAAAAHGPLGVGKGIHPGRVVWVHAPEAVNWAGEKSSEHWWQSNHTDLAIVENMFGQAIRNLAGESTDAAAWGAIFRHFNSIRGRGERGYQAGEKIAVKINLTTCNARSGNDTVDKTTTYEKKASIMNTIDNSPQMLLSLLRHLVYTVGVRPSDIGVGDPTGLFPQFMWDMLHPEFPEVHYFDNYGGAGRTRTEFSAKPFYWSSPDAVRHTEQDYVPVPFAEADYLIDFAVLKGHSVGITACGKNYYGALLRCPDGYFRDANGKDAGGQRDYLSMHDSAPGFGVQGMGQYRAIVDLLGQRELGGKTMLFLVDGLFAGYYWDSRPYPWKTAPFGDGVNGHWPASLFASQDPVAIDSVAYDFLLNEWPAVVTGGGGAPNSLRGSAEDYLHEAALANQPPSGTRYDPNHDGLGLASLGVHEHWNNPTDKQYSRNRGLSEGIELMAVRVNRESPRLAVRKTDAQILVSWPSAQTGYRLEMATNPSPPWQWSPTTAEPVFYKGLNLVSNASPTANGFYRLVK